MPLKLIFLGLLCQLLSSSGFAQNTWDLLADVSFPTTAKEQRYGNFGVPKFGDHVSAHAGKEIQIKGFMLPITIDNQKFILSQYPFSDCFFCGGAGKETVAELKLKKMEDFPIDEPITIRGKLELVVSPEELCYRLVEAEWIR